MNLFVLSCENNKYYLDLTTDNITVGKPYNIETEWTKLYKPVKIVRVDKNSTIRDLNETVYEYFDKYGIENVRGGIFSEPYLSDTQLLSIRARLENLTFDFDEELEC